MKERYGKIISGIILLLVLLMSAAGCVSASEDPNECSSNCSIRPIDSRYGCEATALYQYCAFYVNFWNPNRNMSIDTVSAVFLRNGVIAVQGEKEWDSGFSFQSIGFVLSSVGEYTLECSVTMTDGTVHELSTETVTVYDVKECGTTMTITPSFVSMEKGNTSDVTVKISGVYPNDRSFSYERSNSNISCSWEGKNWYDSDGDGENDSCELSVTGISEGSAELTIFVNESNTETAVASQKITVSVGAPCMVTYNANGGSGAPGSQTKYYDVPLNLSTVKPTRAGYIFLGWSTNNVATTASYMPGGNYLGNKSLTLYAVWKKAPLPQPAIQVASKITKGYKKNGRFSLKAKSSRKLTYQSSNKKVATVASNGMVTMKGYGKTKITVTAPAVDSYKKTSVQVVVSIVPQKTSLKSVTSKKKGVLAIRWKKNKQASGYQVQFSTNKKFPASPSTKMGKISKKRTFATTETNYKSKRILYVRIRAYRIVKGKMIVGLWSNVKKVKIK